jgi:hypothetical protein
MPTATLSFRLPEEEDDFREAQEAAQWKHLITDITSHIRTQLKHVEMPAEKYVALEEIRDLIWASIEERGLKM